MPLNLLSTAAASFSIEGLDAGGASTEDITGLVAVIMAFALPAVIVIAVLLFRLRQQRLQNEIIAKLAASGQPVPPELFTLTRLPRRSSLSSGFTLVAVGAALGLAFYLSGNEDAWAWSLIPLFIGVARLAAWAIEERKTPRG